MLEEIRAIAYLRPSQVLKQGKDGKFSMKDFSKMGINDRLIASVEFSNDGRAKKIKFHNKVQCLEILAKYHRFYEDVVRETEIIRPVLYLPDNGMSSAAARGE